MRAARFAQDFHTLHAVSVVALELDQLRRLAVHRFIEARPAAARIVFGFRIEKWSAATHAGVFSFSFVVVILAAESPLGAVLSSHLVLQVRQLFAPEFFWFVLPIHGG